MSQEEFSSNGEFEMAVAAAAYAIASMDKESFLNKKSPLEGMEISKISKTNNEDIRTRSNKEAKNDSKSEGNKIIRKSSISDQRMQNDSTVTRKSTEKTTGSKKVGSGNEARYWPQSQSKIKPRILLSINNKEVGNSVRSNKWETEADAWEKAQMAKIKTRYEKMKSKILGWETEKKTKAKHRMEQKERGTEQKRAKVLQEYHNEISKIDKTSAEARALADKRERNEELKIREMAKQMGSTGDTPHECVCF